MRTLNLVHPAKGDIKLDVDMTFSDGQPHLGVARHQGIDDTNVRIIARLADGNDLLRLKVAAEIITSMGGRLHLLHIVYLGGARMDRRAARGQDQALHVMTDAVKAIGFRRISVLDPHSEVGPALLGSTTKSVLPIQQVTQAITARLQHYNPIAIVAPDAGAAKRTLDIMGRIGNTYPLVQGLKHRDVMTGQLSGFTVHGPIKGLHALIVDDLCDGGGTFAGLATELLSAGALSVSLYVTHGIFSKGYDIDGINEIYCTNSFSDKDDWEHPAGYIAHEHITQFEVC